MTSAALRHYVDHVIAAYGPGLDSSFPGCFDWARLCRDVPALTERATDGRFDATDRTRAHAMQARADALFRFAHLSTLAVLTAGDESTTDPESLLARFAREPEDEEEERFEVLVSEVLGPLEESFGAGEVELDDRGHVALGWLERSWPLVNGWIDDSGLLEADEEGASEADLESGRPVLAALSRVASILAVLRWMSVIPEPEGSPDA